jgi:hypothetical protein
VPVAARFKRQREGSMEAAAAQVAREQGGWKEV